MGAGRQDGNEEEKKGKIKMKVKKGRMAKTETRDGKWEEGEYKAKNTGVMCGGRGEKRWIRIDKCGSLRM